MLDSSPDLDEGLIDALESYLDARKKGQQPDRQRWYLEHPRFQQELADFFAGEDELLRLCAGRSTPKWPDADAPQWHFDAAEIGRLGDFRLLQEIGRGGMGIVYEAEQISLRRRVALKILPFAVVVDSRQLQRFKNEVLAAAHLHHEHIVPVYAVGEERGIHYYAMQYIEGRSLATLIAELQRDAGGRQPGNAGANCKSAPIQQSATVPVTNKAHIQTVTHPVRSSEDYCRWVARLGLQAASALAYAHSLGIVHRDIKPANLLLDAREQLWITDFGLAQVGGDGALTATGELLGTLRYASPEQILGRRGVVDHRTDLYSLGATLYELLTWRPLFDARDRNEVLRQIAMEEPVPPSVLYPQISRSLETIVLKSLSKDAGERYASAYELAEDLDRFLTHRPILARRPTFAERGWRCATRYPVVVASILLLMVMISLGATVAAFLIQAEQNRTAVAQQQAEEAYRKERQRLEEAEARFELARRSVDEMFRISQEELADRPDLDGLRKRILWSVLTYYQEFLEQRHDEAAVQAELLRTKDRVEKILVDLTVLRAASQLYLLRQPKVLDELQLSTQQRTQVHEFCDRIGKEWWESMQDIGRLPPSERERKAIARARLYEAEVAVLFDEAQQQRLDQINLQAAGTSAFSEPEVIAALGLTNEQRKQIRTIEAAQAFGWASHRLTRDSAGTPQESAEKRILAILTRRQLTRWTSMTGRQLEISFSPFTTIPAPAVER